MRDRFLRGAVAFGMAIFFLTEALGAVRQLRPVPLAIGWGAVLALAVVWIARQRREPFSARCPDAVVVLAGLGAIAIAAATALTAFCSPPNSSDAMAYHMPRVVYWAEQASVRFFPTPYLNQIMLQPMAEYMMLQTYLLSGGDRFVNFVQWFAAVVSILGVSAIAGKLGAKPPGQAIAALFCASLPAGILASSGAKNDYVLAMWLVAMVYFALREDDVWAGCALGLALLTKATAYLFAPWLVAAILLYSGRRRLPRAAVMLLCCAAVNAPQYARNVDLSGHVLGFDSAQANGVFRWRNETFGWKQTLSNLLRHASDQWSARSDGWNQGVYRFVLAAHRDLGIDIGDPATTWPGAVYEPPRNANHETNAPNRWHLVILLTLCCALLCRAVHGRDRLRAGIALALALGLVAFCAYLKWQPFMGRLFLPLFVLGAPLAAMIEEFEGRLVRPRWVQIAVCVFLLSNARLPALENWVRPLRGPRSVLRAARDTQYFADMTHWENASAYRSAVDVLAGSGCRKVGIDITNLQLEYPLQALLRERVLDVQFLHTGVENVSRRYAPPVSAPPCAIACLDCAGDTSRLSLYSGFKTQVPAGKFVVLLP